MHLQILRNWRQLRIASKTAQWAPLLRKMKGARDTMVGFTPSNGRRPRPRARIRTPTAERGCYPTENPFHTGGALDDVEGIMNETGVQWIKSTVIG